MRGFAYQHGLVDDCHLHDWSLQSTDSDRVPVHNQARLLYSGISLVLPAICRDATALSAGPTRPVFGVTTLAQLLEKRLVADLERTCGGGAVAAGPLERFA